MKLAVAVVMAAALGAAGAFGVNQFWPADRPAEPGPIDIGFAQHMSVHHDQALLMVRLYLHNHQTELAGFAATVHDAQLLELGQMRGWLTLWGEPLAPREASMDWMLMGSRPPDAKLTNYLLACAASSSGMPGMATSDELQALTDATGPQRDQQFLQLLARHHEGGLPMLEFAAREARLEPVRQLAQRMLNEQVGEMLRMRSHQASAANVSGPRPDAAP